jgi:ABC-type transport system involved in cytochrome c biogenesis permease subunit
MAHESDSAMLYIHPPLAVAGYVFIFLFTALIFSKKRADGRLLRLSGIAAWLLTFLGLVTGMLWAQSAWGSYWSWDPKETMTLLLFLSISGSLIGFLEKNKKVSRAFAVLSCILVVLTVSTSFVTIGLHSFIGTI